MVLPHPADFLLPSLLSWSNVLPLLSASSALQLSSLLSTALSDPPPFRIYILSVLHPPPPLSTFLCSTVSPLICLTSAVVLACFAVCSLQLLFLGDQPFLGSAIFLLFCLSFPPIQSPCALFFAALHCSVSFLLPSCLSLLLCLAVPLCFVSSLHSQVSPLLCLAGSLLLRLRSLFFSLSSAPSTLLCPAVPLCSVSHLPSSPSLLSLSSAHLSPLYSVTFFAVHLSLVR